MTPLRVRWLRPWGPDELSVEGAFFSTAIPPSEADALLCEWAPSEELLAFAGPRGWYTAEPRTNPRMGPRSHPDHREYLRRLPPGVIFHHAHEDPRFRVPHTTHAGEPEADATPNAERAPRAVAVVSNYGGSPRRRWSEVKLRNRFITHHEVDLFGDPPKWRRYRSTTWALPRRPSNFAGTPGDSYKAKIALMARYRTCVCLENTTEPWYFTEKFVDAVRAGCIPIYHAHPTIADGVLSGAHWVDPADFNFDPTTTLRHALAHSRAEVADQNAEWLTSPRVRATRRDRVFARIAEALRAQDEQARQP